MTEYVIYLRTKDGLTLEVAKYNNVDTYEEELSNLHKMLIEGDEYLRLYDMIIFKRDISVIQGTKTDITLS